MRTSLLTLSRWIQSNILIATVLCFIFGGFLTQWLPSYSSLVYFCSTLSVVFLVILYIFRRHSNILLYTLPFFILAGFTHTNYGLLPPQDQSHVYNQISQRTKVTLTGTVLQMPEFNGTKTRFVLGVDSLLNHDMTSGPKKQLPATGKVRLSLKGQFINTVRPGDQLMILARIDRISNFKTPGVFDYRLFLASKSIFIAGTIASPSQVLPFNDQNIPWYRNIRFYPERVRNDIGVFLDNALGHEEAGLYRALLIGSRSGIADSTLEQFKVSGCMHLLAISGVHMGLLGMMIAFGMSWLMKRSSYLLNNFHVPTLATLFTLLPLTMYAFIAGLNTPVLRALIMAVFFLAAVVLKRQKSILHIIAAAAFIVLIVNPLALFTVSFQLSFSSVLAIALIYPRLLAMLDQGHRSITGKFFAYFCTALLVSIAATLGSLPFMLLHFNRFSTIGPIMNLLVEPFLCLWALPVGLIAIPFIFLTPDIASVLLKTGSLGLMFADKITYFGSTIPMASIWTITPGKAEIIIYCALVFTWVFRSKTAYQKRTLFCLSFLFLLFFSRGLWSTIPGKISEVTFLDIGQGSSSFIRLPNGRTVLVDGGSKVSRTFDVGERVIAPFLWKKKQWRIDDVIITHPHSDHFNGLTFIIERFRPKRIWTNGITPESTQYRELLRAASNRQTPVLFPKPGDALTSEGKIRVFFLTGLPEGADQTSIGQPSSIPLNDLSLVVKLEHGNTSFLFPGDISNKAEHSLLEQWNDLQADILLAPHHGSKGSGSPEFISAVNPKVIVISARQNGRGQYVYSGHLQNWQREGRKVLVTSQSGTVTCLTDGTDIYVNTFSDRPSNYWLQIRPR